MNRLLNLFRWQDILDILILTFVFYRLYFFLKEKRALRMIMALFALLFFYMIAQWIDLPLSVWWLKNLWAVILLFLVVIFQQEIREVLGGFNFSTFFFGRSEMKEPGSKALDKIVEAAFQMVDKGIGGLIVLQRRDDLEELIHGKILLDARINEDMLISIFVPQSPLHDGAVIIEGDRIRYATALLPVSNSASLPREWGTRHRAGVGIAEVSDAECIIISEERKEVLLAYRGKIEKKENKEELKKSLSAFTYVSEGKDRETGWPKKLFNDLPLKSFFLLLACLLWIFIIGIQRGETSFNVPIEYYSIPQNLQIVSEPPREIHVRLKGSHKLLSSIEPGSIRAQINLSNAHSGTNQLSLSEKNINVPPGISTTNFYPRTIIVQLSPILKSNKNQ